jgi:hypothetical protein
VFAKCREELPILFGRPEQFRRLSPAALGEVVSFADTTCMFRSVGEFRRELGHDLAAAIRSDQDSLQALK